MEAALGAERAALATPAGTVDGTLAVNQKPSTPRAPADVRPERLRSRDPAAYPAVTGREEDWRFTPLRRVKVLLDAPAPDGSDDARLDWKTELPAGVSLREAAADDPLVAGVPLPADRLAALALQRSGGATVVSVPAGAEIGEPVLLRLRGTGEQAVVWGHLVLDLGAHSHSTVVIEHSGDARFASLVSVLVGDGAQAEVISVQDWEPTAVHAAQTAIRVGRDARVRATDVTIGGDLVRLVKTVEYAGPGGDAELLGVYVADADQHLEHRLFIDHAAPHCRSRVTYKGALQGAQAHTVWVGDVLIRPTAIGTDTYELNRNLLLTPDARADSIPNLEIETGEITGAGHASATGRFDDEQLFYLMSRGISGQEARRLVVHGFFADLLDRLSVPDLHQRLLAEIDRLLARPVTGSPAGSAS